MERDQDYDELLVINDEVRETYNNRIQAAEEATGKKSPMVKFLEPDKQMGVSHTKPAEEDIEDYFHNHPGQLVNDFRMHDYYEYEACSDYLYENDRRFLWRVSLSLFIILWRYVSFSVVIYISDNAAPTTCNICRQMT